MVDIVNTQLSKHHHLKVNVIVPSHSVLTSGVGVCPGAVILNELQ